MAVAAAKAAKASAPVVPARIGGRYVVLATLGRGGMGAVYRVRDDTTGRELALKQMTGDGANEAARLRFRREFHTMASLRHPRVVEVLDFGVADGTPYYTLELLDGQDLHDLDKVPWQRACALLRDVATALAFIHARRLLHRDLAPRNVRCTSDGRAKLIDFGVLATAGVTGDIAGTPPFMAPEAIRRRPLDHRYDLYGLGALAYRILTGRHAYPARTIEQLETVWRQPPPAPSKLEPSIPPALDELVLALLAHEPLARPPGAAEVIDQLSAIGGLDRSTEIESSHGWIASVALVGRQREMAQIKRAVARAHDGNSRSLLIEAPSGAGKSRLLRELGLEAQLAGTCVVRAESEAAGRGPYGIFHELARQLVAAAPDEALAAAKPRAAILARVIHAVRDRLATTPARPLGDPAEDRVVVQEALADWILAVAATRPLALLVDDIQRCDEASAAVLAAIAHRAGDRKLLVAAALRSDEVVRAPSAIAALLDAGQRLRLRGLTEPEVLELCRSLFGEVPHVPRLARWMHDVAGGSPLHTTELARHLVDRGIIRYAEGLWTIPEDPGRDDLPKGLAEALDARVRSLPADVRSLGEALSVHGGDLPLELVIALADTRDETRTFAALDALAYEEILVQGVDTWRFRHDGLREALLRGLDPERQRELHRRVGETLVRADAGGPERAADIGWHLLRGGDDERGGAYLERAGRALSAAQSFSDCIPPLEAALAVVEKRGGSARVRLELQHMLLMAGCMADRKTALRHCDACVAGFRYWSGVGIATRVGRVVGRHLGVAIGLACAFLRWIVWPRRAPNPYEAFRNFFIVVGYTATVHSLSFDFARTKAMIDLVAPVAMLKNRVPWAVYLLTQNTYEYPRGEVAIVRANCERILEILARDHLTPIRDIDRKTGEGGARYMLALIAVMNCEPTLDRQLAELSQLGLTFFDVGARQARIIHHRLRGEEDRALELEADVELMFVKLGSIWQLEALVPVIGSMSYALTRDTLGLRRMIEQLAGMCDDGFLFQQFLELARAEYLRERGDVEGALAKLEPLITRIESAMFMMPALCALAETLLVAGQPERAREVVDRELAIANAPATFNVQGRARGLRTLALVEAALGDHAGAARRLDEALVEAAAYDSPLITGAFHEARARIALAADDLVAYYTHLADTEQEFQRTRNPVLVARAQRLADAGRQHASRQPTANDEPATQQASPGAAKRRLADSAVSVVSVDALTTPPPTDAAEWVSAVLSGCRGSSERAARVLELLVAETHASSGYLYLRHHGKLVLAAPASGDEPPAELAALLTRAARSPGDVPTVADVPNAANGAAASVWKPIVLVVKLPDIERLVIGAVAVAAGALPLVDPPEKLLAEIARELFEAGDVTHTQTLD